MVVSLSRSLNNIDMLEKPATVPAFLSSQARKIYHLASMNPRITDSHLGRLLNEPVVISQRHALPGGSINDCELLTLADARQLFVKTHKKDVFHGMYAAEARALTLLAQPGTLQVPAVVTYDEQYLVLEAFAEGEPAPDWQEQLGRGLALLHRATRQDSFGFDANNFLGTTLQVNDWQADWLEFWRDQRLGYQLRLLQPHTAHDDPLVEALQSLLACLDNILVPDQEPAVLLHGDLWSGNAAANGQGSPVIYDPASYYGHREAEFGMMRLFGGFTSQCEDAYQEVWPLQEGYERRFQLYKLYHQLNHLNLFGLSYYGGCLDTVYTLI